MIGGQESNFLKRLCPVRQGNNDKGDALKDPLK